MARRFRFDWRITAFTVVLVPVMIALGFWQLHRADYHRALIRQAEQRRSEQPVALESLLVAKESDDALHLQQVALQGQWLDKYFLLENQIHAEKNGYYVFGVMQVAGVGKVLVNRGWIQAPLLRSELPVVPSPTSSTEVGEIYTSASLIEKKPLFAEDGWPKRVGRMNVSGAEQALGFELLPVVVRLREGSPSALATQWPVVNIQPEKNVAYAIQWFAMVLALLICYVVYSFRIEIQSTEKSS